jgi:two-component system, OmpR family, response regulator
MAKILIAAAETRMLDYLEQGLGAAGHQVDTANSIESVIDKLSEQRFDILVSDIFQPVLESIALFTTVARATPKTRIIALMDFKTERAKQYDLSLWVDSVIAKPFTAGRVASEAEFLLAVAARRAAPELV